MKIIARLIFSCCLLCTALKSNAWVYPEHRYIAMLAIQQMKPEYRALLNQLWSRSRTGYENRLTSSVIDTITNVKHTQLDYASWMGIAGDHSCSPSDMMNAVLKSDWILNVADVATQLSIDMANSKSPSQLTNALRKSDIRLQKADINYATRAGSNSVHFLLARKNVQEEALIYFINCMKTGAPLNAHAAYGWFHNLALLKANRYSKANISEDEKNALLLAAFADEAFAIHFLEDVFAAGHIVGTWGNASIKKGTHDYYNEAGVEVVTWDGKHMIVTGDANMRTEDAKNVANSVQQSLEQLMDAATGNIELEVNEQQSIVAAPDSFNVCTNNYLPEAKLNYKIIANVLKSTPVPGLEDGKGGWPRFRSELGLFMGVSTALHVSSIKKGFGPDQNEHGIVGGLDANMMFGFGLDGVLNKSGDGLIFLQVGWRQDAPSTNQIIQNVPSPYINSIISTIPGRSAINLRLRLPFFIIPGDLLFVGPILALTSPKTLQKMAVTAVNGGLIPWQSGIASPIGRFQFVLGREIGMNLFGLGKTKDALFIIDKSGQSALVTYKSTQFDFPVLEYIPLRSFSQDQASTLKVQFSFGVDIPKVTEVLVPNAYNPLALTPIWNITARVLFNWRHYF
jgi:hypothetical protein